MSQILKLSKLDAAERQLNQAIKLFFAESDEVSIHALAEAASQVLADIGKPLGIKSIVRDSGLIREEMRKEWLNIVFRSRNFFKHADKDPNEINDFNPVSNVVSLLDGVCMHSAIAKQWTPETYVFFIWTEFAYPDLFLKRYSDVIPKDSLPKFDNKQLVLEAIQSLRFTANKQFNFKY
ncbi:hypothetical protein [Comamonas testosteroni]|uniref:hypothetical protein n=1 Tax=Comamonas testosteroni TaxID=285 RepID=UPI0026F1792B|nr:hypothetical protein [Comamonas testosteroni]